MIAPQAGKVQFRRGRDIYPFNESVNEHTRSRDAYERYMGECGHTLKRGWPRAARDVDVRKFGLLPSLSAVLG